MEKFTVEELLDVLPIGFKESRNFSPKQKIVMGQLRMLNGLDESKRNGYCYRSNEDLCNDCDIKSEHTLIAAVRKLEVTGLISRKKGSRADGASEYIVFEDKLDKYHDNITANCSVNCSDIEITAKNIDRDCSVNCSTDTDKDIDIDLDKDIEIIICNILNNNISKNTLIEKLNNILEESKKDKELEKEDTNGGKELEAEESDKELDRYQPVETESQASSPTEELSQASSSDVSTVAEPLEEETYIPTEDEQYQLWLEAMTPYLNEIEESVTLGQMKDIRARLSQYAADFLDSHENTSQTVLDRIDKLVISTYNTKLNYLKNPSPNPIELFQYQSRQLN